jgi:hypothetical protein
VDIIPKESYIHLKYESMGEDWLSGEALLRVSSIPDESERNALLDAIVNDEHLGKYLVEYIYDASAAEEILEEMGDFLGLTKSVPTLKGEWSEVPDDIDDLEIVEERVCEGVY